MGNAPAYWEAFLALAAKGDKGKAASAKRAAAWLAEFRAKGYLKLRPKEALAATDYQWAVFYKALVDEVLAREGAAGGRVPSPVAGRPDSAWMQSSDYCFLNVRAVGPDPARPGTFIDALKVLAVPRVDSIHLAPFFDCVFGNVYAIDTLEKINPELVHADYAEAGLVAGDQLRLLIDAIHAAGKTVGFDLEPHTSQFSRVVLTHPEHFRWLEFAPDRAGFAGGVTQERMLDEDLQASIAAKVRAVVAKHLAEAGLAALDLPETPNDQVRAVQGGIIRELIAAGLWTLPSHTWGGVGLPEFTAYNHEHNYPMFEYLDAEGGDQTGHAFGMLTPIKFAAGLLPNTVPTLKHPGRPHEAGLDFFAARFPEIQAAYGFDFVRLDYVDHVFDSVIKGTRDLPLADRPTPYVLERVIRRAREGAPHLGAMAERMGYDLADYASVGFDLILGADVIRTLDVEFLVDMCKRTAEIAAFNARRAVPASVQYAIDTHDTGHPGIDVNPTMHGMRGMLLRLFLARFGSCGQGRRPKYECIGNQDLTEGLYEANNKPVSLAWTDDAVFSGVYHGFEDVYARFRRAVDNSVLTHWVPGKKHAVWFLDRVDGHPMRLVCVCYPDMVTDTEALADFTVFPFAGYGFTQAEVVHVDVDNGREAPCPLDGQGRFTVAGLAPGEVRLYWVREAGQPLPEDGPRA